MGEMRLRLHRSVPLGAQLPQSPPDMIRKRFAILCTATALLCAPVVAWAQEFRIGGTGSALGSMRLLAQAYAKQQPGVSFVVLPNMGSSGGIKAVLSGAVHLAVSSRPLNDAEVKAGAVGVEYGRTPFVFAVPSASPVVALTTQNLVDIYSGRLQHWSDGSRVRLVLRPFSDGDNDRLNAISPAMRQARLAAEQRKGMIVAINAQDTADTLEKTPGTFGPSTLALLMSERRALRALPLDGVVPEAQSLASGRYPLSQSQFVVTGPQTPPAARAFLGFLKSASGRKILEANGHWVP
jgi:phosphate transport system substrate-binding protein